MYPVSRRSQRLELRELQLGDIAAVHAIYGSATATEHLSFEPRTLDQVAQIVTRSVASAIAEPRTEYVLAVVQRDISDLIGFGRLATDPHQQRGAIFGFALRRHRLLQLRPMKSPVTRARRTLLAGRPGKLLKLTRGGVSPEADRKDRRKAGQRFGRHVNVDVFPRRNLRSKRWFLMICTSVSLAFRHHG
ncbi:GNAT family N-acetyltransferase [Streptomyces tauricus]|uniref:GNAT family N-acetyltransferase n=1 Tax=Streptomyces tauricus TaxID=68274 RepID=UPI003F4B49F5